MPKRGDKEFTQDIIEAIERINVYTAEMSYDTFLLDPKTQDAVVRNIEIIGEAAKNLSHDFRKMHREIDWKKIAGMRDKIIHFYPIRKPRSSAAGMVTVSFSANTGFNAPCELSR